MEPKAWILLGLISNFLGTVILIIKAIYYFGKPGSTVIQPLIGDKKSTPTRLKTQKDGFGKRVRITDEEIIMTLALSLICVGFAFQIIGLLIT